MPNQQVIDYIKEQRQAGFSDDQLRAALIEVGWPEEEVSSAFRALTGSGEGQASVAESVTESHTSSNQKRTEVEKQESVDRSNSVESVGQADSTVEDSEQAEGQTSKTPQTENLSSNRDHGSQEAKPDQKSDVEQTKGFVNKAAMLEFQDASSDTKSQSDGINQTASRSQLNDTPRSSSEPASIDLSQGGQEPALTGGSSLKTALLIFLIIILLFGIGIGGYVLWQVWGGQIGSEAVAENGVQENTAQHDNEVPEATDTSDLVAEGGLTALDCGEVVLDFTEGDIDPEEHMAAHGATIDCFVEAARACSPAKVKVESALVLMGVESSTQIYKEIRDDVDGECLLYARRDDMSLEFPPEFPPELVEEQQTMYEENFLGAEGECRMASAELTSELETFFTDDMDRLFEDERCQGQYFHPDL